MYLPKHFETADAALIRALIDEHPFATVLTDGHDGPFVNHLPLLLVPGGLEPDKLIGHMARRNPQWQHFRDQERTTVIFHGPHTYITPTWYAENDVPTWNYAVVHVRGRVRLLEYHEGLMTILQAMTDRFEQDSARPWNFELPDDLNDPEAVARAIVGFEISLDHVEAKLKLSQNRSAADQRGVIEGLKVRPDDNSRRVRELMELEHL